MRRNSKTKGKNCSCLASRKRKQLKVWNQCAQLWKPIENCNCWYAKKVCCRWKHKNLFSKLVSFWRRLHIFSDTHGQKGHFTLSPFEFLLPHGSLLLFLVSVQESTLTHPHNFSSLITHTLFCSYIVFARRKKFEPNFFNCLFWFWACVTTKQGTKLTILFVTNLLNVCRRSAVSFSVAK